MLYFFGVLHLTCDFHTITHAQNLQEMFQFPNISVLELCLTTLHVYGAVVLKLLIRICNDIRRLKLVVRPDKVILDCI
jgi:hypothetical protein